MARMTSETRHVLIGAATVLVFAAVMALGYSGNPDKHEQSGYRVFAIYDSALGLGPGSPVLMAGLPIGAVRRLELDRETNEAVVEMVIQDGMEIPFDSEAAIVSDGIGGGKYVRIIPGGEYDFLADGDTFEYVRGTVDFIELFDKIVRRAESRRGLTSE